MKLIQCNNYSILELTQQTDIDSLLDFLNNNVSSCPNIIIDAKNIDINKKEIVSTLFPFHLNWEKRNKSFILVSNIEKEFLKNIVSLKTREEAIDFFHMEELTRSI